MIYWNFQIRLRHYFFKAKIMMSIPIPLGYDLSPSEIDGLKTLVSDN